MKTAQKNKALYFSTMMISTACFAVMCASLLFSQNLKDVLTLWGQDIQMTVYLSSENTDAENQKIAEHLKGFKNVQHVELITQEKALSDFRGQLASYAPDLAKSDDLLKLIPASYQVALSAGISAEEQLTSLKEIASSIKSFDGVDEVSYGQDWVEKYSVFVSSIQWIVIIMALTIVLASVFVMSNSLRAFVYSKREEIEVMELVGATTNMIRKPFLIQGAQMGLVSACLALAICFVGFQYVHGFFTHQLSFLHLGSQIKFFNFSAVVMFAFGGIIIGAISSYLCVRKINDGWSASQRT